MNGLPTLPLTHSNMPPQSIAVQPGPKQPETREGETLTHRNGPSVPYDCPPDSLMLKRRALELQEKQIAKETTPKNAINTIYHY